MEITCKKCMHFYDTLNWCRARKTKIFNSDFVCSAYCRFIAAVTHDKSTTFCRNCFYYDNTAKWCKVLCERISETSATCNSYTDNTPGCEYCNKDNPKIIAEHFHESSLSTFDVDVYHYNFPMCPYCGRELRENNDML